MFRHWKAWFIAVILISGISMAIIYYFTVKPEGLAKLLEIPPYIILLAVVAHVLNLLFWSLRIKILALSVGENVPLYRCFKIVMVNLFIAALTPSGMGGEPARIYMLSEGKMSGGDATAVTIGERIIDFIFIGATIPLFLLLLGMSMDIASIQIYLILAAVILGLGGLFFLYMILRAEKFRKKMAKLDRIIAIFVKDEEKRKETVEKLEEEFMSFVRSTKILFAMRRGYLSLAFITTMAMWFVDFTIIPLILIGLGEDPNWLFMFTAQLIIIVVTVIPISPGGSGLAEFTALLLFTQRVPPDIAGITVLLWRVLTFYTNLVLGLVYTLSYIAKK